MGVGKFYTAEEALTLLRNMSDFEHESTSGNEIEGDSSDSSEYTPEQQHQVRTDSNIQTLLPKETVNQNATKYALLADEIATTSSEEHVASLPKVPKSKKYPQRAKKLHQDWLLIRMPQSVLYWLMKQPPHQVRNMLLYCQKYLKSKKYPQRAKKLHQNWLLKMVIPQKVSALHDEGAMASDSDLDEDYYIVEDDNESASSGYVPCINYPYDKVYPEDEKNGWVRLDEDTGPPNICRFERSCQNYRDLNEFTPRCSF